MKTGPRKGVTLDLTQHEAKILRLHIKNTRVIDLGLHEVKPMKAIYDALKKATGDADE